MNPQHTVPTLEDDGEFIWDSHAIATYLIEKYGGEDSLYPKGPLQRARVDQRLHFDSGVLFPALRGANMFIILGGVELPEEKLNAIQAALDFLEKFLKDDTYVVGNSLTVADFCCAATVTSLTIHEPLDTYPNILAWLERLSQLPFFDELNTKVVENYNLFFESRREANKAAAKQ